MNTQTHIHVRAFVEYSCDTHFAFILSSQCWPSSVGGVGVYVYFRFSAMCVSACAGMCLCMLFAANKLLCTTTMNDSPFLLSTLLLHHGLTACMKSDKFLPYSIVFIVVVVVDGDVLDVVVVFIRLVFFTLLCFSYMLMNIKAFCLLLRSSRACACVQCIKHTAEEFHVLCCWCFFLFNFIA